MFRISDYIKLIKEDPEAGKKTISQRVGRGGCGPVVIWNLIRKCNLACKHCYTNSGFKDYADELSTEQAYATMDELKKAKVPVIIFSGGEPLLRDDIYDLSRKSKEMGFYTALSTNGTLINEENIEKIAAINYNYVGISLDGLWDVHDKFRGKKGAFQESLNAIRLCKKHGIKVGIRFCLTQYTASDFDNLLRFVEEENIDKFYMSHLNYSGRGKVLSAMDAHHQMSRNTVEKLFEYALENYEAGRNREVVTGNNDADGVYFLQWVARKFPEAYDRVKTKLETWGGNSTGIGVANIDNKGNVNPDSFWWNHAIGNVKDNPFSEIWNKSDDPLMVSFKAENRDLKGRCSTCSHLEICNGNSRVRAFQETGDALGEDPGCYLSLDEIATDAMSFVQAEM